MRPFLHRWSRPVLGLVALAGLTVAALHQRHALAAVLRELSWWELLGAAALLAVAPVAQAGTWVLALRATGADAPWADTMRVWARSFLLRYEPSGAVGYAYRLTARERLGASTAQVVAASAYEQLAVVVATALMGFAGFALVGAHVPVVAWVVAGAGIVLALAARPKVIGGWCATQLAQRGIEPSLLLRGRTVAAMVGVHVASWTATAAGLWLLAHATGAQVGLGVLVGTYAVAWLLGMLVPLAPGGLGLRDGSLVVGLAGTLGTAAATGLALGLRLVGFLGELLAVLALELVGLVLSRRAHAWPHREEQAAAGLEALIARTPRAVATPTRGGIVVVPTYDEALTLEAFVARFAPTGLDLLVVDDSSPDGTGELADALAATRPWMHVLHRTSKDGLGMAYRAGFAWALEHGYAVVGQMDADLSHPPETLARMQHELTAGADLVLGNRYMPGGATEGWPLSRRLLSRVGCGLSKLVLDLPFDDLSGGFKLWRAETLAGLELEELRAAGYAFQVETTLVAHRQGRRIAEVPFTFSERVAGESKMSLAISLEGIRVTLGLRREHRQGLRAA